MQKRVLVSGATGFIGSHIVESLMGDPNVDLVLTCRDKSRLMEGVRAEIREGDLRNEAFIKEVVQGVDVICHAAAWTSLWNHKKESHTHYLLPTLKLIEAARLSGVKQFVFPSSTSMSAPIHSADARNPGIPRSFWPHMCNVIKIENQLRKSAGEGFSAVVLRLGLFIGRRYNLGFLPILLPRLKTHLVPWVGGGKTHLTLIDGRDIGEAFLKALQADIEPDYEAFNIVGPESPTVREVIEYLHDEFGYPRPHFGVPFSLAYPFGRLMEILNPLFPGDPLVTRSIVHLMEETHADNEKATRILGFKPRYHWRDSIKEQVSELQSRQTQPMPMAVRV